MTDEIFTGSFTQQEPIPEEGIEAAVAVLRSGRLHRYNTVGDEAGETALLEQEFAALTGAKYCLAVASGGYAIGCALRAVGVQPGDSVLTNAFTLAPVPGAIAALGAKPVFVEVTEDLLIDLEHLARQIAETDAKVLLLSHMRGHICDMDALMAICDTASVKVIEDCAHTMGANWNRVPSGRHGVAACYSTQTYKHVNSGEGGFLTSDDEVLMARAVMLSGSYMLYERHLAAPSADAFEKIRLETPNVSGRMDNLRAAILRPQLKGLAENARRWNALYKEMEVGLSGVNGLVIPHRPAKEGYVASSFQFLLPDWSPQEIIDFVKRCAKRGVELKWFGGAEPQGFTSRYDSWRYADAQNLPQTDRVLGGLLDMRLPLTFSTDDVALIARIVRSEVARIIGH
ncbi:DegT/DnrJ/EryC1/StrS family aminotransferase [Actibacterium pelagium]|uniref:Aminotransferase DegT n=1 Tax=Actibacterium pelagium TaxID=2029103 RepID=A0A917AEV0_9RHOB|nr:aminotransferase class I/II-fold pyridoxal phosphate-dependent enzyme [Actibacterium pelagium]GGE46571.1 aminotransferase DegT [Actibacterium pelagium]